MNANEFQTLEEYIKDKDNAEKLNISFNGCDYYRYRVARLRKRAISLIQNRCLTAYALISIIGKMLNQRKERPMFMWYFMSIQTRNKLV